GHRVLTAAAGMAGQVAVATAALQELRRVQPNISLAWIATQLPWKLDADREHYLEGFRRAGLEEPSAPRPAGGSAGTAASPRTAQGLNVAAVPRR
ncbi:MAG: hypothetical protein ACJ8FZ_11825, partial [Bradyrhizobium sp.]